MYIHSRAGITCKNLQQNSQNRYFMQLIGSTSEQDRGMRIHLYFMLSIEGSVQSQMVRA